MLEKATRTTLVVQCLGTCGGAIATDAVACCKANKPSAQLFGLPAWPFVLRGVVLWENIRSGMLAFFDFAKGQSSQLSLGDSFTDIHLVVWSQATNLFF